MIETLAEYWRARPFVPFTIELNDGRSLKVPHPEFFAMTPKGGTMFVFEGEHAKLLNPITIVSVTRKGMPKPGAR